MSLRNLSVTLLGLTALLSVVDRRFLHLPTALGAMLSAPAPRWSRDHGGA